MTTLWNEPTARPNRNTRTRRAAVTAPSCRVSRSTFGKSPARVTRVPVPLSGNTRVRPNGAQRANGGWDGVSHGWITADRGQFGGGQISHGRRGRLAHAGVEDDRLSAHAYRRTDCGAGRPIVPGAGACRA